MAEPIITTDDDRFQCWLIDMSDAIERFQRTLPVSLSRQLDLSPDSLGIIESIGLQKYASVEQAKQSSEAQYVDGMARYVGQVFRKRLGGRWTIDFTDKKNAFCGLPQLKGMLGQVTQICPLTLVTASIDRRSGKFIRMVFDSCCKDADALTKM